MEEFPSGQRGQTVNLLSVTSMVRIHPPPPGYVPDFIVGHIFCFYADLRFLGISKKDEGWVDYFWHLNICHCQFDTRF